MTDNRDLRGVILRLENHLSDDDRTRLHFYLGNDVPRRIRDDPSLRGTLNLIESLFDQDKINEKDFTLLINAFDEIQCMDAVKILRKHMKRIQSPDIHGSIGSLTVIMPPNIDLSIEAQEEDKYSTIVQTLLNESSNSNLNMNTNIPDLIPKIIRKSSQLSFRQKSFITYKCSFKFLLLFSIILIGIFMSFIIIRSNQFYQELKINEKQILIEQEKNIKLQNEINILRSRINQTHLDLFDEINKTNNHIEQLEKVRMTNNQIIRNLHQQLQQSYEKQNKTIENLIECNRIKQRLNENFQESIRIQTNINQTNNQQTNQIQQLLNEQINHSRIIKQLQDVHLKDNQINENLLDELQRIKKQEKHLNETILELNVIQVNNNEILQESIRKEININQTYYREKHRLEQLLNEQIIKYNQTINEFQNFRLENQQTKQYLFNKLQQCQETIVTQKISTSQSPIEYHSQINSNTRWKQYGTSVAKSIIEENDENAFQPYTVKIDDERTMIIIDSSKHCIWEWKSGALNGSLIAGGNGKGNRNNQLNYPTDVIIDKNEQKLIICDRENRRIVRWPRHDGHNGETIISDVKCFGIAMDIINRLLYVSDIEKHQVRRWRVGNSTGELVAGSKDGRGDSFDRLDTPHYIFINSDLTLFISDSHNHRVMKWMKDARHGFPVAGGNKKGNDLSQLSWPTGIFVDQSESIYVAECSNNRIVRWLKGAQQGKIITGGNGEGNRTNQFNCPMGLSFDSYGNLYVADFYNNRVQKFEVDIFR